MYRKKIFWLAFALCGFGLAAIVHAQTNNSSNPRTLSDRLQELRESFAGRRPAPSDENQSANSNRNEKRAPHRFGVPGRLAPRRANNFREPTPTEATPTTDEPRRLKPESESVFSRRTNNFKATPDKADDSPAKSSRRKSDFQRIGMKPAKLSDNSSETKKAETKEEPAETPAVETDVAKDHDVFAPIASEAKTSETETQPAAKTAETQKSARRIPVEPVDSAEASGLTEEDLGTSDLLITSESPILGVRTAGPRKIVVGRESIFEVKVQNAASVEAEGVVVSVDLPEWAEVAGTEPTNGTAHPPQTGIEARPLEWHIGRLAGNSRETLRLRIIPRKSMPFDLGVRWTFTPKSSQAKVEVQEPKLTMRIAGADEVRYGQTETYRLIISNPGTGDAEDVVVKLLPNGPGDQAVASVNLGTIPAGDEIVREIAVTPREAGELHVRAEAEAAGGLSAKAEQRVLIRRANIAIEATGPRVRYSGTEATFTVHVTNNGNYMAQDMIVTAQLPDGAKFVRDSNAGSLDKAKKALSWRVVSLPAGATKQLQLVCMLGKPGVNRLSISANGKDDLTAQASIDTRVDALADLRMTVSDPQGPVPTTEEATYQIRIVNRGNKAAQQVDLIAFFSAGMEPVSAEGATHRIAEGQVTFNRITSIGAGEERVLKIRARAKQGGSHILRAELVCRELETKLAVEETTRFYDESSQASTGGPANFSRGANAAPLRRVPTSSQR